MKMCSNSCSIGKVLKQECNQTTHIPKIGIKTLADFTEEEIVLLCKRSGLPQDETHVNSEFSLCFHHDQVYLHKYARNQVKCCDPLKTHSSTVKSTVEISLHLSQEMESLQLHVIPGQKLCKRCHEKIKNKIEVLQAPHNTDSNDEGNDPDYFVLDDNNSSRDELNTSLAELGVSPMKFHAVPSRSRVTHGKRKMEKIETKQNTDSEGVLQKMAKALDVTPEQLKSFDKSKEYDRLVVLLKLKINNTTDKRKIVQLLSLTPQSWTVNEVAKTFNVTNYLVRKSRNNLREKGFLEMPDKYTGHGLSDDLKTIVREFYENDEYSRAMPGAKDFVSISRNVHMQKRLILCNVNELYVKFKEEHPNAKICQSSFAAIRPKWCVNVDNTGSHNVCVCVYHQNVKLMIDACKFKCDQHSLTDKIVCDRQNRDCMIHRCNKCPGTEPLRQYLLDEFEKLNQNLDTDTDESDEEEDEDEEEKEVRFRQWISTDRADIVKQSLLVSEFVDLLVEKLDKLTTHSFIAKTQGKYVRDLKDGLKEGEFVVLGDFAENHGFIVQDAVQSYHWNKSSCTLHPVMIYLKKTDEVESRSLVFISDDLKHDYYFVYKVIEQTFKYITDNIDVDVKKIYYVSDGCPNQYKNVYNFQTICYHESDFGVPCEWIFFATSHGKSPCDGLGGTSKRLTTRASLQRSKDDQITCAMEMFMFCNSEITGINYHFIEKDDMMSLRGDGSFLKERFNPENLYSLPGTKSMHHFVPISSEKIGVKRVSTDINFEFVFNFKSGVSDEEGGEEFPEIVVSGGEFIICKYIDKLWIGFVISTNETERDCLVRFMHPSLPSHSFVWPAPRVDECWVPFNKISLLVKAPLTTSGRSYTLHPDDILDM